MENLPFLPPPEGQKSNFVDPESRGPAIIAVCSTFIGIMWPLFLLRMYSRLWVSRSFGWDDASSILAAIGTTSYAGTVIWGMGTLGPHGWNVRLIDFTENFVKIEIVVWELVYGPTIFFAKLAMFLLYFRLFSVTRWIRVAIYFGMVASGLFYAATTLVFGILCVRRPGEQWLLRAASAGCRSTQHMNYIQGSFGVVSDIYIFVLPIPILWRLQMPLKKKLGVTSVFLAGLIAILASILGLYYRAISSSLDHPWDLPLPLGLAVVELSVGVICSSVPHLPALFRQQRLGLSRIRSALYHLVHGSSQQSKRSSDLPLHEYECVTEESKSKNFKVNTEVLGSIQGKGKFLQSGTFSRGGGP